MTAITATDAGLAPARSPKSLIRRAVDALIAARARSAAREVARHRRSRSGDQRIDEAALAHEIAALFGAGR